MVDAFCQPVETPLGAAVFAYYLIINENHGNPSIFNINLCAAAFAPSRGDRGDVGAD
jgi:hypothetical protein